METTGYNFRPGLQQLRVADYPVAKKEIMEALGVTSRAGWAARAAGKVIPKANEKIAIERILKKYGVTDNIWI